jgi:protein phosphatase/serine/threonine-protein phosphatase Stp1
MTHAISFAATDRGTVRDHNEDSLVDAPALQLWAVADGAGGHEAGEVASGMLADALADLPLGMGPDEALTRIRRAVMEVHASLRDKAEQLGKGMIASTLVVLLLRDGTLAQITRDHSLVQALVDQGLITAAQAESHPQANVITRAIGAIDDSGELDKVLGATAPGDSFLLCSDGLTKVLDEATIAELLLEADPATALVKATLERGARDNVTAVVVQIPPPTAG